MPCKIIDNVVDKVHTYKHSSYKAIIGEFMNLFPELTGRVVKYDKHIWTRTQRGVIATLDNGLHVLFEVRNFKVEYSDPNWSSFRAILIPSKAFLNKEDDKR